MFLAYLARYFDILLESLWETTKNLSVLGPRFEIRNFLLRTRNVTYLTTMSVVYKKTNLRESILLVSGGNNIISSCLNVRDRKNIDMQVNISVFCKESSCMSMCHCQCASSDPLPALTSLTYGIRRSSFNPISWRVKTEVNQVVDLFRPLLKQTKH